MPGNLAFSHKCQTNARLYPQSPPELFRQRGSGQPGGELKSEHRHPGSLTPRATCNSYSNKTLTDTYPTVATWVPLASLEGAGLQITLRGAGSHVESRTPCMGEDGWIYNGSFFAAGNKYLLLCIWGKLSF